MCSGTAASADVVSLKNPYHIITALLFSEVVNDHPKYIPTTKLQNIVQ